MKYQLKEPIQFGEETELSIREKVHGRRDPACKATDRAAGPSTPNDDGFRIGRDGMGDEVGI